jgi:hypothetical protein
MKGTSGRALDASFNAAAPSNDGKLVISEDQVNSIVSKCGQKLGSGLNAGDFTNEIFLLKKLLNELCVTGVVLEQ